MTIEDRDAPRAPRGTAELCVGVVARSGPWPAWLAQSIERLAAEPGVRPSVVVRPGPSTPPGGRTAVSPGGRTAVSPLHNRAGRRSPALRRVPPPRTLDELPVVPAGSPAIGDVDALIDLAGWLCPPAPGGPWPCHGVWRFGFGPGMSPDVAQAAADDIASRRATAGIALVASTAGGRARILRRGTVRTLGHSWTAHRDQLLLHPVDWPALACRGLGRGGTAAEEAPAPAATTPTRIPTARLTRRLAVNRVARAARFLRDDQWHIGVVDAPIAAFLRPDDLPCPRWLPEPPRSAFYADPFPFGGGRSVAFERFSLRERVGTLCTLDLDAGPGDGPRPLAAPAHHVAYPYIIETDGGTYCTPETAAAGEVCLYRLTGDPPQLDRVATLVDGVAAVDPTVTHHAGRWWLFFTDAARDVDTDLHIWYADDLLGPWSPHARNPVKVDVATARPAGTPFTVEGVLHRPAMDNSRTYGGRIVINRVTRLAPDEFVERPAAVVPPFRGPFDAGIHTLAAAGPVTIVDGKRVRCVPSTLPAKVRHRRRRRGGPPV